MSYVVKWVAWKRDVVMLTGLDRDALHIYAAVLIQAFVAVATRRKLGDLLPWLAVAMLELVNEGADIAFDIWPDHAMQAGKSVHDVINTMIMPTILLIVFRSGLRIAGRS